MRCACGDEDIQGSVRFKDLSLVESCTTRSEVGGMEGRLANSGFYYYIEVRLPAGSSAKQSHWDRRWSLPRKNDTSQLVWLKVEILPDLACTYCCMRALSQTAGKARTRPPPSGRGFRIDARTCTPALAE